jgi:organic radical activating enzyme
MIFSIIIVAVLFGVAAFLRPPAGCSHECGGCDTPCDGPEKPNGRF